MAPVNPPTYMQAGTYPARLDRLNTAGLLTPHHGGGVLVARSGVKPTPTGSGMFVAQSGTPDKYVQVAGGVSFVAAASALGGSYECSNDGGYAVRIPDAHPSLPRKDLVVARVFDAVDDSGSTNLWDAVVIQGTAAASPSRPATPNGSTELAEVAVAAGALTIVQGNITDLRKKVVALGGVLPVRNASELPSNPYTGFKVWREDLAAEQTWDGAAWQMLPYGAWTPWTTTWTGSVTNPVKGNLLEANGYEQKGKTVNFRMHLTMGSTTTYGSGAYGFTLPVAPKEDQSVAGVISDSSASNRYPCTAWLTNSSGIFRLAYNPAGSVGVAQNAPFTWATGDEIMVSGSYEAA